MIDKKEKIKIEESLKRIRVFQKGNFSTASDLAKILDITPQRMSKIMKGNVQYMLILELQKLREQGADLNYIFGLDDKPHIINEEEVKYGKNWRNRYFEILEKYSSLQEEFINLTIDKSDK